MEGAQGEIIQDSRLARLSPEGQSRLDLGSTALLSLAVAVYPMEVKSFPTPWEVREPGC